MECQSAVQVRGPGGWSGNRERGREMQVERRCLGMRGGDGDVAVHLGPHELRGTAPPPTPPPLAKEVGRECPSLRRGCPSIEPRLSIRPHGHPSRAGVSV